MFSITRTRTSIRTGSKTHDFANITVVTVGPKTQKVTVDLPENCNGISFQRQDDPSNWATIAYNLG